MILRVPSLTCSLRKRPTFGDVTTVFPAKWRLRNDRRNSLLMGRHYPDLGSASDWSCRVGNLIQPIRSTTQIWVVTRHQYGISALVSQTSFGGETSGSVAKCRLFPQPTWLVDRIRVKKRRRLTLERGKNSKKWLANKKGLSNTKGVNFSKSRLLSSSNLAQAPQFLRSFFTVSIFISPTRTRAENPKGRPQGREP